MLPSSRPSSSYGRVDPSRLDPETGLPSAPNGREVNQELIALFNRLLAFDDDDLVLEARAHVEACTGQEMLDFIEKDTVAYIITCMGECGQRVSLQTTCCSALANICTNSDRLQGVAVSGGVVGLVLNAMRDYLGNSDLQYHALDVLASLAASNSRARDELCSGSGVQTILQTMRHHAKNPDIQFAGACTLAGCTMNSPQNVASLLSSNGIKTLVDCFRNATIQEAKPGANTDDWKPVSQWSALALKNIARCHQVITPEVLNKTDFGRYGECLKVDELKWQLLMDCKRIHAALED
eukprot:TRINITY_DN48031_c0_g1_i1.p1 TRINITY_DN48031_c0_g1~~TRINITY_DN48031_c0_g1_i1.p1  ORF type:complete len:295 (+),score=58.69 TRINITY_DN48031_c0_g1_i1:637-1521(+)